MAVVTLVTDKEQDRGWSAVYAAFFCCAFHFAHLARWAAAIFLRADADIVRLGAGR